VVVIELVLAFVPENTMIRTMRWMRALVEREPAPAVQLHGDSVAQGALLASDVARVLPPGTTVRNAALQGSGPEFTYFLLERQIARGRAPKAIVIAHSPHVFVTERVAVLTGGFLHWSEIPEAMLASHHFFDALQGVLAKVSFTLRHREEIADLLKGRGLPLPWNAPIPTEEWIRDSGAKSEIKWAHGRRPLGPLHPSFRQPFVVDRGEQEFLRRTLALARKHDVRVFWFAMPEHEAIAAARDSVGFHAAWGRFVDSLATRGEIEVLRRDSEVLPARDFADYTHLRLPAAMRVSREVGEKLAGKLAVRNGPP